MAVKVFFLLCVDAVIGQTAFSQCIGGGFPGPYGPGWGYDGIPYDNMGLGPFDGYGIGPVDNFGFSPYDSPYGSGLPAGYTGVGPFGPAPFAPGPMYGGGLPLASSSALPPASLSVVSENFIEGIVSVVGQLPFLASVSMSGEFPTIGAGAVSYCCGNGGVGIMRESAIAPGVPIAPAVIPAAPAIVPMEYTGPYPYGPALVDDYRGPIPYTGCSYGPLY